MDAKKFFRIHKKEIKAKIEFQKRIDDLDEESIDDLIKEIKSEHCSDKEALRVTLYMIRKGSFAHPNSIFLFLRVIEEISDSIKRFFSGDELALIFRFISNKLIFLKLYNIGAIEFESVIKMIKSFHSNLSYIEPLIYFYPEIKKNSYGLYVKARSIINKEVASSLCKDIEESNFESDHITDIFNNNNTCDSEAIQSHIYLCDDPKIENEFLKCRETGKSKDFLANAIRNDDVEEFQSILSKTNTSVNDCVKYSIFEQCNIVSKRRSQKTLRFIEYAAFFGSLKVFKFLINIAELTEKVAKNAVKGGNYEIIHLCEYYKINFSPKCLTLAIRFHRNEIVDYLIENHSLNLDIANTIASIQYYNWEIITRCIPIFLDPNPNITNDNFSALATASINGYLDIVEILCSLKNININHESEGWNPVMYAAFKGYVYILKYFMSHFKSIDKLAEEDEKNMLNDESKADKSSDEEKTLKNEISAKEENSNDNEKETESVNKEKANENIDEQLSKIISNDNENDNDSNSNKSTKESSNEVKTDDSEDLDDASNIKSTKESSNKEKADESNDLDENTESTKKSSNKEKTDGNEYKDDDYDNDFDFDYFIDHIEITGEESSIENESNTVKVEKAPNIIDLTKKWDGHSPLEIAVYSQKLNVVEYLLQYKTVFEEAKKEIQSLIDISRNNHYTDIEDYLKKNILDTIQK